VNVIKTLVRRVLHVLGFRGWHIGRYLLVRVAAEPAEPEVGAHPLERYLFECSLSQVLRRLDINCVLDVGANQGQYGLMLRGLGYSGYIVSFEPVNAPVGAWRSDHARAHSRHAGHGLQLGPPAHGIFDRAVRGLRAG